MSDRDMMENAAGPGWTGKNPDAARIAALEAERNECQRKATDAIMQNDAIARENDGLGKKVVALEAESAAHAAVANAETEANGKLQAEVENLKTKLGVWYDAFGTSQLTHATERLRVAEAEVERLRVELGKMTIGRDGAKQLNDILQDQRDGAVRLLREVEWTEAGVDVRSGEARLCPYCFQHEPAGHAKGCKFLAALPGDET